MKSLENYTYHINIEVYKGQLDDLKAYNIDTELIINQKFNEQLAKIIAEHTTVAKHFINDYVDKYEKNLIILEHDEIKSVIENIIKEIPLDEINRIKNI